MRSLSPSRSWNGIWAGRHPSAVIVLIALNLIIFVIQNIAGIFFEDLVEQWFALSTTGIKSGYIWQLVTYMFLHGGVWHLLINMLVLYFFGRQVESLLGPRRFCFIYFAGGVVGAVLQMLGTFGELQLLGASAGVSAVLLAFTTMLPELEISLLLFFVLPVRLKAKYLGIGVMVVSALFALAAFVPKLGDTGTGHLAHFGGGLFGWLYVRRMGYGNPYQTTSYFAEPRQVQRRELEDEELSPSEFISEQIDPILDKISREGIHSLTRKERRILEKGREKIAAKTSRRHF